jgi:hypothetical protein
MQVVLHRKAPSWVEPAAGRASRHLHSMLGEDPNVGQFTPTLLLLLDQGQGQG